MQDKPRDATPRQQVQNNPHATTHDTEKKGRRVAGDGRQRATKRRDRQRDKVQTSPRRRETTRTQRQTEGKERRHRGESEQSDGAHAPAVITRPSDRGEEEIDETKDD